MTSADEFNLQSFCCAVERRDAAAQIDCYADDAAVRVTSLEDPSRAVRVLQGRAEVQDWITARCAEHVAFHVIYQWIEADEIMVTEESRRPDAFGVLSASTANVANNQITHQSVVTIQTANPEKPSR